MSDKDLKLNKRGGLSPFSFQSAKTAKQPEGGKEFCYRLCRFRPDRLQGIDINKQDTHHWSRQQQRPDERCTIFPNSFRINDTTDQFFGKHSAKQGQYHAHTNPAKHDRRMTA